MVYREKKKPNTNYCYKYDIVSIEDQELDSGS